MVTLLSQNGHLVPVAVTTGSLWPTLDTIKSVDFLVTLAMPDIELTLQQADIKMNFNGKFRIPILPHLGSLVRDNKLTIRSIHAPHLHAEDGSSSKVRTRYLARSMELCQELNCRILVTHPFHLFNNYEATTGYLSGQTTNVWQALMPDVRALLRNAEAQGVTLTLENVKLWADDNTGFFNKPENVARFLNDVDSQAMGLTLDIVHAQLAGNLDSFLALLNSKIVTAHIADIYFPNSADIDSRSDTGPLPAYKRMAIGDGQTSWSWLIRLLQALPGLQALTIELVDATQQDIVNSVSFLQANWPKREVS